MYTIVSLSLIWVNIVGRYQAPLLTRAFISVGGISGVHKLNVLVKPPGSAQFELVSDSFTSSRTQLVNLRGTFTAPSDTRYLCK